MPEHPDSPNEEYEPFQMIHAATGIRWSTEVAPQLCDVPPVQQAADAPKT